MKFSQKNFKTKLYEDQNFRNVFITECVSLLRSTLDKEQIALLEQRKSNTATDIINQLNQMMIDSSNQ